jgi:hypothetical protein
LRGLVGTDRPDDADIPADEPPDRSADRSEGPSNGRERADGDGAGRIETRSRQEYYEDLRAAVAQETRIEPRRTADPGGSAELAERAANGKSWEEVTGWSSRVWAEYQRRWPADERGPVDRSDEPRGSWHGDGTRSLDRRDNEEIEKECVQIAKREKERITPALLEIESRDHDRHLVGFEYRLKGHDRIKEKVSDGMEENDLSAKEAISLIPDTIRYTFQYEEARYVKGIWADIGRLRDQGFDLLTLKNSWSADQYRGINSQWIDPDTGQRFELQFHTRISFEAKQITHDAYERLRSGQADELEEMVLEAFQRKVSAEIPVPPGATGIPNYPEREQDAR